MMGVPPLMGGVLRKKRTEVGPGATDRYWGGAGWAVGQEERWFEESKKCKKKKTCKTSEVR